jgi:choline dehydrogenase-like flavoprotein
MQVITPPKVYPVLIIGSGASGGTAAWNLTRHGIDVLPLDTGEKFDRRISATQDPSFNAACRRRSPSVTTSGVGGRRSAAR